MHLMTRCAVALAALAFAACGSDDEPTAPAGESSGGAFPVTVQHKYGATEIPSEPKRVVTIGYTDQDITLALGVVPVGVGDFLGGYEWRERPWAQQALGGKQPEVVGGQEINFEAVAAQRPDLIIAINAGLKKPDYERLSKIAPTVGQSGDYIDFGMPWDEQTLLVGKALGRSEQAQKVVDDVEAKFTAFREAHPDFDGQERRPRLRRAGRLRRVCDRGQPQPLPRRPRLRDPEADRRARRRELLRRSSARSSSG